MEYRVHMEGGLAEVVRSLFREGSIQQVVCVAPLVRRTEATNEGGCLHSPYKVIRDHGKSVQTMKPDGFIPPMINNLIGIA